MTCNVHSPKHYTQHPHECIWFTERLNFCLGNALKYVWRCTDKNGIEDLEKSKWYLNRVISGEINFQLDSFTWTIGCDKLEECNFQPSQKQILKAIWFVAQGIKNQQDLGNLKEVLRMIDRWIMQMEAPCETSHPTLA